MLLHIPVVCLYYLFNFLLYLYFFSLLTVRGYAPDLTFGVRLFFFFKENLVSVFCSNFWDFPWNLFSSSFTKYFCNHFKFPEWFFFLLLSACSFCSILFLFYGFIFFCLWGYFLLLPVMCLSLLPFSISSGCFNLFFMLETFPKYLVNHGFLLTFESAVNVVWGILFLKAYRLVDFTKEH